MIFQNGQGIEVSLLSDSGMINDDHPPIGYEQDNEKVRQRSPRLRLAGQLKGDPSNLSIREYYFQREGWWPF
jgi:hypothetical protein